MPESLFAPHFSPDIAGSLAEFLHHACTACIATTADDGTPHAANVQFVHDDHLHFYWVSSTQSEHSRHIRERPNVAVTIYGHDDRPTCIHGVQMHGRAATVTDEYDRACAWNAFVDKFVDLAGNPRFRELIDAQQFYCFQPTWLRWIDNRRGFGFKVEANLDLT